MIVVRYVMFTCVLLVGSADVCCSKWGAVWDVDEGEGDLHLGSDGW